ncbi:hypothetical protein EJB05_56526, partial [Eragrostis curvula]
MELRATKHDLTPGLRNVRTGPDHNCNGLKEACFEFLSSPSNLEAMLASEHLIVMSISKAVARTCSKI